MEFEHFKEKRNTQEEPRMDFALRKITELGYEVDRVSDNELQFLFQGHVVRMWPYTGYHSGKSIRDGRGLGNLLRQLKK